MNGRGSDGRAVDRETTDLTLVTGGAGYVGSVVVHELLRQGRAVRVLDSLLQRSGASLLGLVGRDGFSFVHGDVRDENARKAALDGVTAVVHLAAIVGDPACARDVREAWDVNSGGTLAMLEDAEAAGVRRFVFASTCSNYGRIDGGDVADESWELRPVSEYAETKVAAELAVLGRARPGFAATCLRFATVYGASPRMRFDLTVNEFARDAALSGRLVVYGEQFWRPYIHVRDAARAVALVLGVREHVVAGQVFNVGSTEENYRKLDLVELLRDRRPEAEYAFVRKEEDPRDYRVSFDKVRRGLGFHARWTVPSGIDEVLALLDSRLISNPFDAIYRNA